MTRSAIERVTELPRGWVPTAIRTLIAGTPFGLALYAVVGGATAWWWWWWWWVLSFGAAIGYAFAAVVLAALTRSLPLPRMTLADRVSAINAVALSFVPIALYGVASATRVIVQSDGAVHPYNWLPLWISTAGTALLLIWSSTRILKTRAGSDVRRVERDALVLITGPFLLFLELTRLPGVIGPVGMFHEGEGLVTAKSMLDGLFPWRDLFFIHGLIDDGLRPGLGLVALENSRWASVAAVLLLEWPFAWILTYYLNAYLYRRDLPFLIFSAVVLGTEFTAAPHFAFVLQPIVYLLLAALLAKATPWRAVAFALALVVQAVGSPEASYSVVAAGAAVILFELVHRQGSVSIVRSFSRTLWSAGCGILFIGVWLAYLATQNALLGFLYYYRTFVPAHELTGGIPVEWVTVSLWGAGAPLVVILLAIWYFIAHRHRLRSLERDDWVMGSAAFLVFLYYPKFLNRADGGHVQEVFAVAVPVILYVMYRVASALETVLKQGARAARRSNIVKVPHLVTTAILVAGFLMTAPLGRLADAATRLAPTVAEEPWLDRLGYANPEDVDRTVIRDLAAFFRTNLRPGERVFDFSNEPALPYYFLDLPISTRYFHVSMAIRLDTQLDLIEELRRDPPRYVILYNDRYGLNWDNIENTVRNYLVSGYLLDHYTPSIWLDGHLILVRKEEQQDLARNGHDVGSSELYFRAPPCGWGYAPNFLSFEPRPDEVARAVDLPFRAAAILRGWAIDPATQRPASEIRVVIDGQVVQRTVPSLERPDVAAARKAETAMRSGYSVVVPITDPKDLRKIHVFAVSTQGAASELAYSPESGLPTHASVTTIVDPLNGSVPVRAEAAIGWVDTSQVNSFARLDLPPGTKFDDFRWLEIETADHFNDDTFTLSDRADATRAISFKTLERSPTRYRVYVGSCPQWHGYEGSSLILDSAREPRITAVRLLP